MMFRNLLAIYLGICNFTYLNSYWTIRLPQWQRRIYSSIRDISLIHSGSNCLIWKRNCKYSPLYMAYDSEEESLSIRDEIAAVIGIFLSVDEATLREKGINCMSYTDLTERSYILCKGRIYESIMDDLLQSSISMDEIKRIEQIDVILRGFVLSERKVRSRQKMNYILAGASTNRLDSAIRTLAERS